MARQTYPISHRPATSTRYYAVEVKGEPVVIENTGLEFFIHRALNDKLGPAGSWRVAEKSSGAFLSEGNTRKEAIELAKDRISRLDSDQLDHAIKKYKEDCGDVSKLDVLRYDESTDTWIPTPQKTEEK